eukprot:2544356-Amphidinium_carterae.2
MSVGNLGPQPKQQIYPITPTSGNRRCQYWGTKAGCKFGGTCNTEHSFAECEGAEKGPTKGNSSDKGSRPHSGDRGRSLSPGADGSAKGLSKGRSGSNDKDGGKGKPRGKSPGQSP